MSTRTRPPRKGKKQKNPELERLRNLARFWQQRYDACGTDHGELARVSFERARAAVRRGEREGVGPSMYELAQLLSQWAEQAERAQTKRAAGGDRA